ncbi:ubiquitin conjugation factor E4 A [Panulirus ornatus]|uniref:ubiquitin conjugation factor E4 A n=1 Tax=Panulirus ornatus TaxID=150431 RepID=UPI003A887266
MSAKLQDNPFALLFCSVEDAEQFSKQHQHSPVHQQPVQDPPSRQACGSEEGITAFLEDLLLVTTRLGPHPSPRVLLTDADALTTDTFQLLLFDRLLLENPNVNLIGPGDEGREEAGRAEVVVYLVEVYQRCWAARDKPLSHVARQVQAAVITNLATALEQPELYRGQHPDRQLVQVFLTGFGQEAAVEDLAIKLTQHLAGQGTAPPALFDQLLAEVTTQLGQCCLMTVNYHLVDILDFYASSPYLATLITKTPEKLQRARTGRAYQNTPLGSLLSISCLPKNQADPYEFFEKPSLQLDQTHKDTENSIWRAQSNINSRIYKLFYTLLKVSPEAKVGLLTWVESCLEANSGRAGMWNVEGIGGLLGATYVCDGFMVNLGAVMLQLAQPFTQDLKTAKILKVDPTYCAAPKEISNNRMSGAYTGNLGKQTTLIPHPEDSPRIHSKTYSFTSACFFLTHRALHLGVQVVQQKLHKLYQELGRLQQEFQDTSTQRSSVERMRSLIESQTTIFLSFRTAILEPNMAESILQFLGASAEWLVQMALCPPDQCSPPSAVQDVKVPLPDDKDPHLFLQCIPEFLVETLTETISALRRYNASLLDSSVSSLILPHLMSFIIVFMGSPNRMNNPHLRARLAETLESLIPENANSRGGLLLGYREQLFATHPLSTELVTALLQVFVSIEMTGQSVAFEEKFNYRRPMYEVIKYLWKSLSHRRRFSELADEALSSMESAKPPLFLRFVNLLMNDATFLLDEALSYMSKLRESQKQRESGEWTSLPAAQREERERSFHLTTVLARYHNMLGAHTIQILILLTREMPQMFIHNTLVDRMAGMLNYFLCTLVGPKQRTLKVRDMEKCQFRPGEIVSDICSVYTNLYSNEAFCLAVSADGRSYTPELFSQAYDVLYRIGRASLAEEIQEVARMVVKAREIHAIEEDIAADAPEEFLDPIMSHLMTDPVILPSSRLSCDRQTIARHLLSDQMDPFNRQPLTMEEVLPNTELKERITAWLEEQRALRAKQAHARKEEMED